MALPLADESVDGVVISFGLRNVADPDAALREFRGSPGRAARLVVCEFSRRPGRRSAPSTPST